MKRKRENESNFQHPQHIKPLANGLLDDGDKFQNRSNGLGSLALFSDELILYILKRATATILPLTFTSKILFSFCASKEILDYLVLRERCETKTLYFQKLTQYLNFPGFYSDILYYSWYYSEVDVEQWVGSETIERRSNLSLEEFENEYNSQYKPVIITDLTQNWPCQKIWTLENLTSKYKTVLSGVSKTKLKFFDIFYTEMFHLSSDDSKNASVFEIQKSESEKTPTPLSISDYEVTKYFSEDIFQVLGEDKRPPFRWFLLGPARSGSCFHQDPNFTAAWNASIVGRKKFVLFPGDIVPPGVIQKSEDDFEPPHIVIQWFVEHYSTLKKGTFLECIVQPGEMIFVPSGWWHTVLNMDDTLAVTQNFADKFNIENIYDYVRTQKPELFIQLDEQLKLKLPELHKKLQKEDCLFGHDDDDDVPFFL